MKQLTATAAGGSLACTVKGVWELRAGSQDTEEWLARGGTYPGNIDAFAASQSDSATGYDPAPKMAILNFTAGADTNTITLAGGITSVYMVTVQENDATPVFEGHASNNMGLAISWSGLVLTLQIKGGASDITGDIMVMYS